MPLGAFAAERVLLPREPIGALVQRLAARGRCGPPAYELDRTLETLERAVGPADAARSRAARRCRRSSATGPTPPIAGVVALPFDPPLTFPIDLASRWAPTAGAELLVERRVRLRDAEGWLTSRAASTELPDD